MLLPITNVPRPYAWGARDAITSLLGWPPTGGPEAELWLGTHPGSPARTVSGLESLADLIGELPFLLKVLAAERPLSLQVHPTAAQAQRGFRREDAAGIPVDAPERVYRDPYEKAEIILAVSDRFEAQVGFRSAVEATAILDRLLGTTGESAALADALRRRLTDDATVGEAFLWLLSEEAAARDLVATMLDAVARDASGFPVQAWLAECFPGDAGAAASLLLNHVVLERGESLFIEAGVIHGYLHGVGIELLGGSDNVVRGGLTPKHIDRVELAAILKPAASMPSRIRPVPLPGDAVEHVPPVDGDPPFRLLRVLGDVEVALSGPAIALCLAGEFHIDGALGEARVSRGDAVYASVDEGTLRIAGSGELYLAR